MGINSQTATQLGFPKPEYTSVERERRWLCRGVPRDRVRTSEAISDLYVSGVRLRLREARPMDGGTPMLRLTRKADLDRHTRLITSIYLPEDEFAVLAASLQGSRINKVRHRLHPVAGVAFIVDEFEGELEGLFIAEAEFKTQAELEACASPEFALCEVTDDPQYTGGHLVKQGLPGNLQVLLGRG